MPPDPATTATERAAEMCDNGRLCGPGKVPVCPNNALHWICTTDGDPAERKPPIKFCDRCFQIALRMGLVKSPFMSKEVFDQNEKERIAAIRATAPAGP